jgi:N-methylhydantoinase A
MTTIEAPIARQKWELTIALPGARVDADSVDHLLEHFRAEYGRRYGEGALMAGAVVELVAIRAIGTGATAKPRPVELGTAVQNRDRTRDATRQRSVAMARSGDPTTVVVHDAHTLEPGDRVRGPALVDGRDTTIWVPDATTLEVDRERAFVMEVR